MQIEAFGVWAMAAAAAAFFAGGFVKGVIGLGLPLVAVPVLATAVDPAVAVALMAVPVMSANAWQAWQERAHIGLAWRLWPLVAAMVPATVFATSLLAALDRALAAAVLGAVVLLFCASRVAPAPPRLPRAWEPWLAPAVGAVAGVIGGVSNFFGPPLVMYLTALRLERDAFVAGIAALFLLSGLPLYAGLAAQGVLDREVALLSASATVPVFAGVGLGRLVRRRVSQRTFERILIAFLVVVGVNLLRRGFV